MEFDAGGHHVYGVVERDSGTVPAVDGNGLRWPGTRGSGGNDTSSSSTVGRVQASGGDTYRYSLPTYACACKGHSAPSLPPSYHVYTIDFPSRRITKSLKVSFFKGGLLLAALNT